MSRLKGIVAGATLGSILGSLAIVLYPNKGQIIETLIDKTSDFADQAKEYTDVLFSKGLKQRRVDSTNSYVTGGVAGLILGASTALFLTPTSGKQLRAHVTRTYNQIFGRTSNVIKHFKNNSHPLERLQGISKVTRRPVAKRKVKSKTS